MKKYNTLCGTNPEPETVKCPFCLREYTDWNETEFIGWHGICVECEMKGIDDEQ